MSKRKHFGAMNDLAQMQANPTARAAIEAMKGQLLIVFLNRLGGAIEVPVSEVDATGDFNLSLRIDQQRKSFFFEVGKKP